MQNPAAPPETVTVAISKALHVRLRAIADKRGEKMYALVERLIRKGMKR